jgi:hypothetical protein
VLQRQLIEAVDRSERILKRGLVDLGAGKEFELGAERLGAGAGAAKPGRASDR